MHEWSREGDGWFEANLAPHQLSSTLSSSMGGTKNEPWKPSKVSLEFYKSCPYHPETQETIEEMERGIKAYEAWERSKDWTKDDIVNAGLEEQLEQQQYGNFSNGK